VLNLFIHSVVLALAISAVIMIRKGSGHITWIGFLSMVLGFMVTQKGVTVLLPKFAQKVPGIAVELTGPVVFKLKDSSSIYKVDVSPDSLVAVINTASSMHVWSIKTGLELWSLSYHAHGRLSSTGKYLLVGVNPRKSSDYSMQLLDTKSGDLVATIRDIPLTVGSGISYQLFNADDSYILLGNDKMEAVLYSLRNLSGTTELNPISVPRDIPANTYGLPPSYSHMGFYGDGESLVVHAFDTLERWSVGQQPRLLSSHRLSTALGFKPSKFSDDGTMAFYCQMSGLDVADTFVSTPSEVTHIPMESEKLTSGSYSIITPCAISPDNEWVAAGLQEASGKASFLYTLNLWRTDGTPAVGDADPEPEHDQSPFVVPQVDKVVFSPDSSLLYVADQALHLHVYNLVGDIKVTMLLPEQLGFEVRNSASPLLATSNRGALLSYHGATQAVWIPVDKPVAGQATH
jgi:hypothetical protein